ncbi:MAG: hypothetical protein LBV02_01555 [Bacteroidales bacterium]|nr:hypothetical protein [Bacteroidales bacterium]
MTWQGTTWKLAAYVNVGTGTEILPLPDSTICPRCFSFTFDTDSTATGQSLSNTIVVELKPRLIIWSRTAVYDDLIGNTALFYAAGKSLVSFSLEGDQMKLFYNDKKDYMLFRKQQL